jgi:hypothetical protein
MALAGGGSGFPGQLLEVHCFGVDWSLSKNLELYGDVGTVLADHLAGFCIAGLLAIDIKNLFSRQKLKHLVSRALGHRSPLMNREMPSPICPAILCCIVFKSWAFRCWVSWSMRVYGHNHLGGIARKLFPVQRTAYAEAAFFRLVRHAANLKKTLGGESSHSRPESRCGGPGRVFPPVDKRGGTALARACLPVLVVPDAIQKHADATDALAVPFQFTLQQQAPHIGWVTIQQLRHGGHTRAGPHLEGAGIRGDVGPEGHAAICAAAYPPH